MISFEEFYDRFPLETIKLSDSVFTYRYYKNPNGKATLVLLTGGIGLSDLFYLHFEKFAQIFSVITFDYQIQYANDFLFAKAVAEVLELLHEKVWLVGQSLGGIVAQIIAKSSPEVVYGLVLSNTCSLSESMSNSAHRSLLDMIESQKKMKMLLNIIPFTLYKKLVKFAVMNKKTDSFTPTEKKLMEDLCNAMLKLLTKEYEMHMIDFLIDTKNYFGMIPEDFSIYKGKVLLVLSEDDTTFNDEVKQSLIDIMPFPKVITNITGGHLALLVRLDKYAQEVSDFIIQNS